MVSLAPPLDKTIHRRSSARSMISNHKAATIGGVLLFVIVAIGVATFLPDIVRYVKMRRM